MRLIHKQETGALGRAARAALAATAPILLGYLFVGMAFGLLLQNAGYGPAWAALMSATVYAGSMQFVAINFLGGGFTLLQVALMTLAVNLRHMFYGLTFLEKFRSMGKRRYYMIFALTDETYSLLCGNLPAGVDGNHLIFFIALFNQIYWIAGSLLGSIAGRLLPFDTTGIDFAMTALFIVICMEQWRSSASHLPALLGFAAAAGCVLLFGPDAFLLPALLIIALALMLTRGPVEKRMQEKGGARMSAGRALLVIGVVALCTLFTRAMPFLFFRKDQRTPRLVLYLGAALPAAMLALLVVYCYRGLNLAVYPYGLPELLSGLAVALLHLWKRNNLLSILGGTALYMMLVQWVFV